MPYKCCVPNCKGNYLNGPKVSVFSFPTDEPNKKRWLTAIKRSNFIPNKTSKVCELHFQNHEIERISTVWDEKTGRSLSAPLQYPRLISGSVPSQLPGCAIYLSKPATVGRESPLTKKRRLEMDELQKTIDESQRTYEQYNSKTSFTSFEGLKEIIGNFTFHSQWILVKKDAALLFLLIKDVPFPSIQCSVKITEQLSVEVFFKNVSISQLDKPLPEKVSSVNEIDDIINSCQKRFFLNSSDESSTDESVTATSNSAIELALNCLDSLKISSDNEIIVNFLKEQISMLNVAKNMVRYSTEYLVFCSILQSISPHAYKFVRSAGYIRLPCISTVKSLCSKLNTSPNEEQSRDGLLNYIATKFHLLNSSDKTVVLLIDEIHLKSAMDYKGGSIVGAASEGEENATTACVFMVTSMLSSYKDVVHILPINKLTGQLLYTIIRDIIIGLETLGFEVLAVITDNNSVNRKAMSLFSSPPQLLTTYEHPKDSKRELYFLFDTVHILKCIRNNWLNQQHQELTFPGVPVDEEAIKHVASFSALKEMHAAEKHCILKFGYSLNLKTLYPSSMERQNVKLALNVFDRRTVSALRVCGPLKSLANWSSTSMFIEQICTWWDVVNVKTPWKGVRLRNDFQKPVTHPDCKQIRFLNQFLRWLQQWEKFCASSRLTQQTHSALAHTVEGQIKLAQYLLTEKNYSYVLLGKFQTDNLEDRFGKYRQLSGGNYHVSVRQIFESEKKLRIQSVLPLVLKSKQLGDITVGSEDVTNFVDVNSFLTNSESTVIPDSIARMTVDDDDIDSIEDSMLPIITYIAGYCSYGVVKKLKCDYCSVFVVGNEDNNAGSNSLIMENNRGGLKYPTDDVISCVSHLYILVKKSITDFENEFLHLQNQKKVVIALFNQTMPTNMLFSGFNCSSHSVILLLKHIITPATNILLNNYVKKRNDIFVKRKNMPTLKRLKHPNLPNLN